MACWGPCVQDPATGVVTDHGLGTAAFRIPAQALLTAENSLLLKTTAWACGLTYGLAYGPFDGLGSRPGPDLG